jgi:hypothetical protein
MTTIAMSGNDVIIINNTVITDLGVGNVAELTLPNEIANVKTGKNGNSIYGLNYSGRICDFKLMVIRGSANDGFLNSLLAQQNLNFAGTVLLIGQFIKKIGDGKGNITSDTYNLSGGIFTKQVGAKTNTEGEAEQSQSEYMIKFSNNQRTLV